MFAASIHTQAQPGPSKSSSVQASSIPTALASQPLATTGGYLIVPLSQANLATPQKKDEDVGILPSLFQALGALGWPITALLIAYSLLKRPEINVLIQRVWQRIGEVKVAGLEIKFTDGAKTSIDEVKNLFDQIPQTHKEWVSNSNLGRQFELVVADIRHYLTGAKPGQPGLPPDDFAKFRFTLHVPDVLVEGALRQLVNYIGCDRGGSGRIFSIRLGIIGQTWRMRNSQFVANNMFTHEELIKLWGMTELEAHDTSGGKKVHLAFLITAQSGLSIGVLYADAASSQLFLAGAHGAPTPCHQQIFDRLERAVLESCEKRGLTDSLVKLEEARIRLPQLNLYETRR
jgi:hypothetical protein